MSADLILTKVLLYLDEGDRKEASKINWSWRRAFFYPTFMKGSVLRLLSMDAVDAASHELCDSTKRIRVKLSNLKNSATVDHDHELYLYELLTRISERFFNVEELNFKRCPVFRRTCSQALRSQFPHLSSETCDELLYQQCKPFIERLAGKFPRLTTLNFYGCTLNKSILLALIETFSTVDSLNLGDGTLLAWQPLNQVGQLGDNRRDSESDVQSESDNEAMATEVNSNCVTQVHGNSGELGWDLQPISSDWLVDQIAIRLKSLKRLNLKHSGFKWESLRKLADLADHGILLEELKIGDSVYRTASREPDAALKYFVSKQTALRSIDIQLAVLTGVNIQYVLDNLPALNSLQAFTVHHNRSHLDAFPLRKINLKKFVKLRIGCLCSSGARILRLNFDSLFVDQLCNAKPALESLNLRHFRFQLGDIPKALSALTNLQELYFTHCSTVGDSDVQLLAATCTRLKKLGLICVDITDAIFTSQCLCRLRCLEILNLSACKEVSAVAYQSFHFTQLRRLLLKKMSGVSDSSLIHIAEGCSNLEKLSIIDTEKQLSNDGVLLGLQRFRRLHTFYVVCDTITDQIAKELRQTLLKKLTVNTLRLLPPTVSK